MVLCSFFSLFLLAADVSPRPPTPPTTLVLLQLPPFSLSLFLSLYLTHIQTHTHRCTLPLAVPDVDGGWCHGRPEALDPSPSLFLSRKHSLQTRVHKGEEQSVDKFPGSTAKLCLNHSYLTLIRFLWITGIFSFIPPPSMCSRLASGNMHLCARRHNPG